MQNALDMGVPVHALRAVLQSVGANLPISATLEMWIVFMSYLINMGYESHQTRYKTLLSLAERRTTVLGLCGTTTRSRIYRMEGSHSYVDISTYVDIVDTHVDIQNVWDFPL